MTPRIGAATSDSPAAKQVRRVEGNTAARLRAFVTSVAAATLVTLSGCCCYSDGVETTLKKTEARLAYDHECEACVPDDVVVDFKRGWRAGFLDVSQGHSGTPPAVPPHRYRTYNYQTGSGKRAAAAWYQGFAAGAAAAKCQGLDLASHVFAVETPCCTCHGTCHCDHCPPSGVLPSTEAMLRRQAMRQPQVAPLSAPYQERIIEERIINDRPVDADQLPSPPPEDPVQPGNPGSALSPNSERLAEQTEHGTSDATCEADLLVNCEIAPPEAVQLPSNVDDLDDALRSPAAEEVARVIVEVDTAENQLAEVPDVTRADAADVETAGLPQQLPTPATAPVPHGFVSSEQSKPQSTSPLRILLVPVVTEPVVGRQATDVPPVASNAVQPPRFQPFTQRVAEAGPGGSDVTPDPANSLSLAQPEGILLDPPQSPSVSTRHAPVPRVAVRETPRSLPTPPLGTWTIEQQPEKPRIQIVEQSSPQATPRKTVAPPDSIGTPVVTKPRAIEVADITPQPLPPSARPVTMVRVAPETGEAHSLIQLPKSTTSVLPDREEAVTSPLRQPSSVRTAPGNDTESPGGEVDDDQQPQPDAELPNKLVVVPDGLALPSILVVDAPQLAPLHPVELEQAVWSHDLRQPGIIQVGALIVPTAVDESLGPPSQLTFPNGIRLSSTQDLLEEEPPLPVLSQPIHVQPPVLLDAVVEFQFPQTVWPAAYEIGVPAGGGAHQD